MILKSRIITELDYPLINEWCKDWGFPSVAIKDLLPNYGVIIEDEENKGIWLGFVYLTDSFFAHPEWIISNKFYKNKSVRKLAFSRLFEELASYAKKNTKRVFLMSVKDQFLIKSLEAYGFNKADINMTNLIKEI